MFTVALMAALASVGFARGASAGVVVDLTWRDTSTDTLTILPGDAGATCNMGFNNPAAAGRCLDITMTLTGDTLIAAGTSVQYDSSSGLVFSKGFQWFGVTFVEGKGTGTFAPLGTRTSYLFSPGVVSDFNGFVPPPNGPPALPAGTYKLGTIVWTTSGVTTNTILNAFLAPLDAFGNGAKLNISSTVVLNKAFLNVIPEPGTASLLGLGLVGLIVAGRRSRK
jgi:hypothetical protein